MSATDITERFVRDGYYEFPFTLDTAKAGELLRAVRATRTFDESLFLTEEEWNASPKTHRGTNPNTGRNFIETHPHCIDFVRNDPRLLAGLEALLGKDFCWLYVKLVCRVPTHVMPQWLQRGLGGKPTSTLGAYIRPEYRDIAYQHDTEMHQDVLEWVRMEQREHRLIPLYVDLDDSGGTDASVYLVPQSHTLGVSHFPHTLKNLGNGQWQYSDDRGNTLTAPLKEMGHGLGYCATWHGCMLHGAKPVRSGPPRLVLRCILLRSKDPAPCGIDLATQDIHNPQSLVDKPFASGPSEDSDGFIRLPESDFLTSA